MPSREGRVGWELWGGVCRWGAGLWRVASRRSCLSWVSKAGNGEDGCLSVSVLAVADKVNYCAIIPHFLLMIFGGSCTERPEQTWKQAGGFRAPR